MDYSTIKGVAMDAINESRHKFVTLVGSTVLDVDNANECQSIGHVYYPRWKVVGLGVICTENCTENEDPLIEFGKVGDDNAFATLTFAITGTMVSGNYTFHAVKGVDVQVDSLATGVVASWADGDDWNSEMNGYDLIDAIEAQSAGMTSGKFRLIAVLEVF